jgi:hypothetical protein
MEVKCMPIYSVHTHVTVAIIFIEQFEPFPIFDTQVAAVSSSGVCNFLAHYHRILNGM